MLHLRILQFWAFNCTKMRLAAGLCPDQLGSYSAPPDPPSRYGEGREGQEAERGERGREGRGGRGERKGHSNPLTKSLATGLHIH